MLKKKIIIIIVKEKVQSLFWMDSPVDNYKMLSVGCSNFLFSFTTDILGPIKLFFPQHILPFNGDSKISTVSTI